MKRTILTITLAFLSCVAAFAQYELTAARGVGIVRVSMRVADITRILGKPIQTSSFEEEKKAWENSGYHIADETVFSIPFDTVYSFDNSNPYAVWKVYAKNDTAVILNICKLVNNKPEHRRIAIEDGPGFNDNAAAIIKYMGTGFIQDPDKNENYMYPAKGIGFVLIGHKVNNIFVFKPVVTSVPPPDCPTDKFLYSMAGKPAAATALVNVPGL